jgi:hypothetical protein
MKYLLELLFFPPGINIVIAVLGLALWNKRRRAAVMILAGDTALLYVFSLPFTAWALMSALQTFPPLNTQAVKNGTAQAIVVLGAGRYSDAPEYGGDTVSRFELERLRYGAHLQRLTHLPLMLVGGIAKAEEGRTPEALLMKEAATEDFGMDVTWTETRSRKRGQCRRAAPRTRHPAYLSGDPRLAHAASGVELSKGRHHGHSRPHRFRDPEKRPTRIRLAAQRPGAL